MLALGAALLALVLQAPFAQRHAVLVDEGVLLQIADNILDGKVPYRDAAHNVFPFVFYLAAGVFKLFGTSIEAARMLAACIFAVATGAMILIARWWCSRAEALFFLVLILCYRVWSFPHWHMLNYSPLAVALSLVATWLVGEQIYRTSHRWSAFAGIACGLAILSKQDSGGATALALGIALLTLGASTTWNDRFRRAAIFGSITTGVVLSCLAAVWSAGFLTEMLRDTFYGPLYGVSNFDYLRRPALLPLLSQDPHLRENIFSYFPPILMDPYGKVLMSTRIFRESGIVDTVMRAIYHAPWIIALVTALPTAYIFLTRRAQVDQHRILLLLLAGAFLLAFNRPHDWVHLLVLYPATLILLASLVPMIRRRSIIRWTVALAVSATAALSIHLAIEFRQSHSTSVETAHGRFYEEPRYADSLRPVIRALAATSPTTPLLAYPHHAYLNFLAHRDHPNRYLYLWPVEWNQNRDKEIIQTLESRPDTTVLYSPDRMLHLGAPREFAPEIFTYLVDHYSIAEIYGAPAQGPVFFRLVRHTDSRDRPLSEAAIESASLTKQPRLGEAQPLVGGGAGFIHLVQWPFRRVVAVKTQPAAEVAVRIPMTAKAGDRILTSHATNPNYWSDIFTPPVRFRLAIAGRDGEKTVYQREVKSGPNLEDRKWFEVSADLSEWQGQRIELVLGVFTRWGTKPDEELAGWEIPRIVSDRQEK